MLYSFLLCSPHIVPDNGSSDDDYDDDGDEGYGRQDDGKNDQVDDDTGSAVLNIDRVTKARGILRKESSQVVQKHVAFQVRLYVKMISSNR